jgi:hypothetical protein
MTTLTRGEAGRRAMAAFNSLFSESQAIKKAYQLS